MVQPSTSEFIAFRRWTELACHGNPPPPRSGHQAFAKDGPEAQGPDPRSVEETAASKTSEESWLLLWKDHDTFGVVVLTSHDIQKDSYGHVESINVYKCLKGDSLAKPPRPAHVYFWWTSFWITLKLIQN